MEFPIPPIIFNSDGSDGDADAYEEECIKEKAAVKIETAFRRLMEKRRSL